MVKEWLPTSNYWDPIRDRNEAFEIVDIRGFKKLGRTGYYLVQYKPRIIDADDEFPKGERETMATNGLVSYK